METCYKVFRREVIQSIKLNSNRFGIEPEITAKVARRGYRIYEVPISYYGREYWEGKKINWKDGFSAIWTILKYGLFDDTASEPPTYKTLRRLDSLKRYNQLDLGAPRAVRRPARARGRRRLGNDDALSLRPRADRRDRHARRRTSTACAIASGASRASSSSGSILDSDDALDARALRLRHGHLHQRARAHDRRRGGAAPRHAAAAAGRTDHRLRSRRARILFGTLDQGVGHQRRYEREELIEKLRAAGFEVEDVSYQNRVAKLAWWLNSRIFHRTAMPAAQSKLFDFLRAALEVARGSASVDAA